MFKRIFVSGLMSRADNLTALLDTGHEVYYAVVFNANTGTVESFVS